MKEQEIKYNAERCLNNWRANGYFQLAIVLGTIAAGLFAAAGLFFSGTDKYASVNGDITEMCNNEKARNYHFLGEDISEKQCWTTFYPAFTGSIARYNIVFKAAIFIAILLSIDALIFWNLGMRRNFRKDWFTVILIMNILIAIIFLLVFEKFIDFLRLAVDVVR